MSDLVRPSVSPFDAIRHEDERGEYWLGREVQPLMGYTNWRQFTVAVERARVACANSGADPDQHFEVNLKNSGEEGGDRAIADRFWAEYAEERAAAGIPPRSGDDPPESPQLPPGGAA